MGLWSKKNNEKKYPDFWLKYLNFFNKKRKDQSINTTRFVAFDTETTGFDYINDRILSIGAVAINKYAVDVSDQVEIYLQQEVFNEDTVEIHGIRKNNGLVKISEKSALKLFIEYIGDAVLIAHHAEFDKKMINKALQRHGLGVLKNRILDTGVLYRKTKHIIYKDDNFNFHYSLDDLSNDLKISKSDRHTASGDAFITAVAFLKIVSRLKKNNSVTTNDLFYLK